MTPDYAEAAKVYAIFLKISKMCHSDWDNKGMRYYRASNK